MKKTLFVGVVATLLSVPAYAVRRCVALNNSTTCAFAVPEYQVATWESLCTTSGQYVPIQGVVACATIVGTEGQVEESLYITGGLDGCWCKMVSPAVSRWVAIAYDDSETSVSGCEYGCAYDCAQMMSNSSLFRKMMFSTLGAN